MYQGLRVAVVVPAFNEAHNLGQMLSGIPDYIDDIIVVDDGSCDGTDAAVSHLSRPGLVLVRHSQNRGVGAAVASGYRRAVEQGSEVVVVMAGDGQMDPADLPQLLSPIVNGRADYVKGNRFARSEVWRTMPHTRLLGNILLSLLTRPASGYWHLFDSQCGFTAVTRRTLAALDLGGIFPGYGYPNDLLARLRVAGARVVDVPVRPIYGPLWRSGISLKTAIYPVLFVVLRSFVWRLSATGKRPPLSPDREPPGSAASRAEDGLYRQRAPTVTAPLLRPEAPPVARGRRGRSAPGS